MAEGDVARGDAVDGEAHDLRILGLRAEGADDRLERAYPAQRSGLHRGRAPAHRLRPRKGPDDRGQDLGQHLGGRPAGALDRRDVELALLGIPLDFRLVDRGEPGALEEALDRGLRRADAGPASLLAHVPALDGQPGDVEREPPRRRERRGALVDEAALHQRVGDEPAQVLRGPALHARRDFFGEEFEEEVGHGVFGASLAVRA